MEPSEGGRWYFLDRHTKQATWDDLSLAVVTRNCVPGLILMAIFDWATVLRMFSRHLC